MVAVNDRVRPVVDDVVAPTLHNASASTDPAFPKVIVVAFADAVDPETGEATY